MNDTVGPGSTFAGYRVEELLGRGGMGVVYRATDLSLERPVALKLIAPELAQDKRFRSRFLKEPRLAASLDHPNVIPIYEAGEADGQLYLAMRYVEGSDLKTLLARERKLAPERTLRLLAQVASALDAAHRRGLVHRDVKPANVLLDGDEHVYLTDFGITKQVGGASTETGQMVGTLDYLAPEQIRGGEVDGRSDGYALACLLYECLAGTPPFRRETEAETMWAHMQAEPPKLRGHAALDPILAKGLAKEKDDRYETCSELIEAASDALGLAAPAGVRHARTRRRAFGHRRAILAAGLVVLAATVVAAAVALTGDDGDDGALGTVGNGVAVVDPRDGRVASFIESATAPSNIAVGEGAVWALNTQDNRVSRIDPKTKAVTGRFETDGVPTDLAAGGGAVWVGNGGGGGGGNFTVSVSRLDSRNGRITRTVKLPDRTGEAVTALFNWGVPAIAVGAGAVWATNPDGTVSRIDARTGRLVKAIDAAAGPIAAGEEGVWFLDDGPAVTRIDPRTNRTGQKIPFGAQSATGIAVGDGSVWVTAEAEGVVWRIDPGPKPVTRTIEVGAGVTYLAFGAGSVWAANYLDGTLSRIDPSTNTVSDRIPLGAAQSLAAGAGSAWVSTAGGTEKGTLPASVCGELVADGGEPDVLIASDLPLQGPDAAGPRAMADAVRLVLRRRGFKAGEHTVGLRSCDNSTAQTGAWEDRRCAANANAYARAERLVAVIGPYNSPCAQVEIPILNRAPGGPVAMIGPTTTEAGLTRAGSLPEGLRGEPGVYYPTGERNFVRVVPGDDLQGAAHAVLAKQLRLRSVYVVDDGSDLWRGLLSNPFRRAAGRLGVKVAGAASVDSQAKGHSALARRIADSGVDGVVLGVDPYDGGDRVLKALRAELGKRVTILAGFYFAEGDNVLEQVGPAARGLYVTSLDVPPTALPMTAAGRNFAREAGALRSPAFGVLEAGQAAELVLDAIARSDGSRGSVLEELRASEVKNGILGSFRFDRNGDTTAPAIPILRITGRTPPDSGLPLNLQGTVVDRVIRTPPSLVR